MPKPTFITRNRIPVVFLSGLFMYLFTILCYFAIFVANSQNLTAHDMLDLRRVTALMSDTCFVIYIIAALKVTAAVKRSYTTPTDTSVGNDNDDDINEGSNE